MQHRGLREQAAADIQVVDMLINAVYAYNNDIDYRWLAEEMKRNLPLELDFQHEAANANRARECFAHRADIVVPRVFSHLTTHRVMVMSFEEGASVADKAAQRALGLEQKAVVRPPTVSKCTMPSGEAIVPVVFPCHRW